MGSKNKFKPKLAGSATPWKTDEKAEGDNSSLGAKSVGGVKKRLFNRKAG